MAQKDADKLSTRALGEAAHYQHLRVKENFAFKETINRILLSFLTSSDLFWITESCLTSFPGDFYITAKKKCRTPQLTGRLSLRFWKPGEKSLEIRYLEAVRLTKYPKGSMELVCFFPRFTRKIDKMWVLEHHLGRAKKHPSSSIEDVLICWFFPCFLPSQNLALKSTTHAFRFPPSGPMMVFSYKKQPSNPTPQNQQKKC